MCVNVMPTLCSSNAKYQLLLSCLANAFQPAMSFKSHVRITLFVQRPRIMLGLFTQGIFATSRLFATCPFKPRHPFTPCHMFFDAPACVSKGTPATCSSKRQSNNSCGPQWSFLYKSNLIFNSGCCRSLLDLCRNQPVAVTAFLSSSIASCAFTCHPFTCAFCFLWHSSIQYLSVAHSRISLVQTLHNKKF